MKYAKGKGFLILEVGNVGTFYNNLFFYIIFIIIISLSLLLMFFKKLFLLGQQKLNLIIVSWIIHHRVFS